MNETGISERNWDIERSVLGHGEVCIGTCTYPPKRSADEMAFALAYFEFVDARPLDEFV